MGYDVMAPLNGSLAGLVSITAGCNVVTPQGALGIGFIGGLVYSLSSFLLKQMRIDDPIDAFAVHGACGICGDPDSDCVDLGSQTAMQIVGVLCIILWTSFTSVLLFGGLRLCKLLRVSEEAEIRGLHQDHHMGYTGVLRYAEEIEATELDIEKADVAHPVSGPKSHTKKVHPGAEKPT